ncbi:MAG: DUF192 domain-containing protein [Steroidobacteraceae bacterium]
MRLLFCMFMLGFGAMPACAAQPSAPAVFQPVQLRDFPRSQLAIERRNGRDSFQIWLAETPAQQEQGLMWIRQLPVDYGMLFLLGGPRPMSMWMKNTYVSLDMLFINGTGRITHIVQRATPLSEAIITSNGEVAGVLEIAGGEVMRRGIAVGDRVMHPAIAGNR